MTMTHHDCFFICTLEILLAAYSYLAVIVWSRHKWTGTSSETPVLWTGTKPNRKLDIHLH